MRVSTHLDDVVTVGVRREVHHPRGQRLHEKINLLRQAANVNKLLHAAGAVQIQGGANDVVQMRLLSLAGFSRLAICAHTRTHTRSHVHTHKHTTTAAGTRTRTVCGCEWGRRRALLSERWQRVRRR